MHNRSSRRDFKSEMMFLSKNSQLTNIIGENEKELLTLWPAIDQWRSQNAKKVTEINGRLLDQAMSLFNCAPFQNGNFS